MVWLIHVLLKLSAYLFHNISDFLIHIITISGKYRGKSLLDVGTGPVVMPIITAAEWFDEIYLSDLSKDNVDFLRKWLDGDTEATKAMEYQMSVFTLKDGKR